MEIDAWRRQQPDPMPNLSEAYGDWIEKGLDAEAKGKPTRRLIGSAPYCLLATGSPMRG